MQQHLVLVATDLLSETDIKRISEKAEVVTLSEAEKNLDSLLPKVEVMVIGRWPKMLEDRNKIGMMKSLKMVQCIFAGVDLLPFNLIPDSVVVCSNAGAYSQEVAEHAIALMLSAAHSITRFSTMDRFAMDEASELTKLSREIYGKTAGIVGFGGIGKAFASMLRGFNIRLFAYSRRDENLNEGQASAVILKGRDGLEKLLRESDVVLLSIPLTNNTRHMIGKKELDMMKEDAMIVNVARGEIIDSDAMAEHLKQHPRFIYATDVGWRIDGKESGNPGGRFSGLKNYLTTPHVAGLLSSKTGRPSAQAADNVLRFLQGLEPHNRVKRDEYIA
ncbi:MAG: NAD(P)-dependent oxidoreductase [Conexivisphaerales archaeon]